jgi:hypothetical protein
VICHGLGTRLIVIPAQAGIQLRLDRRLQAGPKAFAGVTSGGRFLLRRSTKW